MINNYPIPYSIEGTILKRNNTLPVNNANGKIGSLDSSVRTLLFMGGGILLGCAGIAILNRIIKNKFL